jgi:hypothetical protein
MKNKLHVVNALTATREGAVIGCHFAEKGVESWRVS